MYAPKEGTPALSELENIRHILATGEPLPQHGDVIKVNSLSEASEVAINLLGGGSSLNQPGVKDDSDKIDVGLLLESFPRALLMVAQVAQHGARKYTRGGWQTVLNGMRRYDSAGARHNLKRRIEGNIDPEFGLDHWAHEAWNVLAKLELHIREQQEISSK